MLHKNNQIPFEPTEEEIKAGCQEIRSCWSEKEFLVRSGGTKPYELPTVNDCELFQKHKAPTK